MYSYTYDEISGGIILNSSPTNFSKEPRPVYAPEMNLLGFSKYWNYDNQSDIPYMWAESGVYWYRNVQIAKTKGGDIYTAPELLPICNSEGEIPFAKSTGHILQPIDIDSMCEANRDLMSIVEVTTVRKIVKEYEKFKHKLDAFHVAFSGGKDSTVLLDLMKKALPAGSFIVIFGDTGMEFPDTYKLVDEVQKQCEADGTPFYIARSHFCPEESWRLFGPPARVLRWCCSVHKSAPQTLKMREITGKSDYIGMDFVGVRAHESAARSSYQYENFGKKQKGQYSYNPILEWTSAEIWLYIFMNRLLINEAYKKGSARVGCLLCPMGGGRGDFIQRSAYKHEVDVFISLIKEMNSRYTDDPIALNSYVSSGGWNARKNGRDLKIADNRYYEEKLNDKFIINVFQPRTNWLEWIKTVGDIPFEYKYQEMGNGYRISCDEKEAKKYPYEFKKFKQVFRKSAYCVGCRVCETNCRNGCLSFTNGLAINDCIQCGKCHEILDGCLVYHSLRSISGDGTMRKKSINSFANHAPKPSWVNRFFDEGNNFWGIDNGLGTNQIPMFKRFLRESGLIDAQTGLTTSLFQLASSWGWAANTTWGLMLCNLAYNRQFGWYIHNMDSGVLYDRSHISDLLVLDGLKKDDATSVIYAFKRFCDLPLGTVLNWGFVELNGRQITKLCRLKCTVDDNRVFLYSLYLFAEHCNIDNEFNVAFLYDEDAERDGVSPVRLFGLYDEEELKSILLGLSSRYPEFINATYTNDLKTITLRNKTSQDVLKLFEEEL